MKSRVVCLLAVLVLIGLTLGAWRISSTPQESQQPAAEDILLEALGIVRPKTFAAEEALMSDDAEVIGVEVEGAARAYSLKAFAIGMNDKGSDGSN